MKNKLFIYVILIFSLISFANATNINNCTSGLTSNTVYDLTNDITFNSSTPNCLVFDSTQNISNIILDGHGFKITDTSCTSSETGILFDNAFIVNNITIKNVILECSNGITYGGSGNANNLLFDNITFINNWGAIALERVDDTQRMNNVLINNTIFIGNQNHATDMIRYGDLNNLVMNNFKFYNMSQNTHNIITIYYNENVTFSNSYIDNLTGAYETLGIFLATNILWKDSYSINSVNGYNGGYGATDLTLDNVTDITTPTISENRQGSGSAYFKLSGTSVITDFNVYNLYIDGVTKSTNNSLAELITLRNIVFENVTIKNSDKLDFNTVTSLVMNNVQNSRDYFNNVLPKFIMNSVTINTISTNNTGWLPLLTNNNVTITSQTDTAFYNYSTGFNNDLSSNTTLHTYFNNKGYIAPPIFNCTIENLEILNNFINTTINDSNQIISVHAQYSNLSSECDAIPKDICIYIDSPTCQACISDIATTTDNNIIWNFQPNASYPFCTSYPQGLGLSVQIETYNFINSTPYLLLNPYGFYDINIPVCLENWIQQNTTCNGYNYTILYADTNNCNTSISLPIDNGTLINCFTCTPNWLQNNTECINDTYFINFDDTNNCGNTSGLPITNGTQLSCAQKLPYQIKSVDSTVIIQVLIALFIIVLLSAIALSFFGKESEFIEKYLAYIVVAVIIILIILFMLLTLM